MIDTHIHLHRYDLQTLNEKIERWKENEIQGVIAVSDDLASSYKTLELHDRFPDFVYPCVGFHPEFPFPNEQDKEEWKSLVKYEKNRITAIGEIGLPHYELNNLSITMDEAINQLEEYVDVALLYDLPIILHAVHDKARLAFFLLQEKKVKKAHFHWLKTDLLTIDNIVNAGYYISVTPEVCYRRRDKQLVENVPLSQLLIETDGPWSFDGEFQKVDTTPEFLHRVVAEIAKIKKITKDNAISYMYDNTNRCYSL